MDTLKLLVLCTNIKAYNARSEMYLFNFCFLSCVLSLTLYKTSVNCGTANFAEIPFLTVWNSPSEICDEIGMPLNLSYFDIVANSNDTFEGNEIVIFYKNKLGLYPRIDAGGNYIHGGLPQLANIKKHLTQVAFDVARYIPSSNFTGLAVIDWESWRPIFDRNGYNEEMKIYIHASKNLVRKMHPDWSEDMIENEARKEFEASARKFMQSTLEACRKLRPGGHWGFYGFPNCYNYDLGQRYCTNKTMELNDRLNWLFESSSSLYPSIYLNEYETHIDKYDRVYGQLKEALRLRKLYRGSYVPIFAYTKYNYDETGYFYTEADLNDTIRQVAEAGMNGVTLWGSSASFRTATDCKLLRNYIDSTLGPFVKNVTLTAKQCGQELCHSHGRCVDNGWKQKQKVTVQGLFIENTYRRLFEKLLGTFYFLFDALFRKAKREDVTQFSVESSHEVHHTNTFTRYSCVCFQGWTGRFCQNQVSNIRT